MHIPDGFLTPNVFWPAWLVSVCSLGYCLKKVTQILKDRMVPLMGVTAAFVFSAQMLNFPVIAGTSGHILGAALSAVLLGPWPGVVVMAVVLTVQSLIFQDGGFIALGANIFNMSILGVTSGYFSYRMIRLAIKGNKGIMFGVALGSWLSVITTALACGLELVASGVYPLDVAMAMVVTIYALLGAGEAIVSCLVIGFVLKVRPDLVYRR